MQKISLFTLGLVLSLMAQSQQTEKLWYNKPANASVKDLADGWTSDEEWLNALPVGNGFLGAMVFGDINKERLQLNEKSLWSGSPDDNDNPDAASHLAQIRQLLFAGKYKEATEITNKTQICKGAGSGSGNGSKVPFGCFQTLGDLWIDFNKSSPYKNYYRDLDIINGISSVKYEQDGITFQREIFASYPDRAIIVRLTASKPDAISCTVAINRPELFTTMADAGMLTMTGTLKNGKGGEGMKYKVCVIPRLTGGTLKKTGNTLTVSKATDLTLIITAATNYRLHYPDYMNPDFEKELEVVTAKAAKAPYKTLRSRHIQDFSSYMKRSSLKLEAADPMIPSGELLKRNAGSKNELFLYGLYYQYGRYLLLSSSRKGSLPANLQGIWANKIQTPWNGDYHTDINIQMNYWPAEVSNLSECHEQLTDLIRSIVEPGRRTARIQYGMNGWCIHPITNVWGYTAPGEHPGWGMHIAAGGWLCQHIWEHYAFTRDTNYLRTMWPVLKGAAEFYLDWLVKDSVTGKLVSGPATSPENAFIDNTGYQAQMSMGPSHDQEVINDLFTHIIEADGILKDDHEKAFVEKIRSSNASLLLPAIGPDGRLMEWAKPFREADPTHRHSSHLYALHPANQISFSGTPALAAAVRKTLETRGDGGNGWSLAWKICFWSRLHDGDRSLKLLNALLKPAASMGTIYDSGGGSYLNLFDACPPFQIDGNFGATAGIAEMLMQSHEGFIELLPALPAAWHNGKVKGLCARGGFVINLEWRNNRLVQSSLLSNHGGKCQIKYGDKLISLETVKGRTYQLNDMVNGN